MRSGLILRSCCFFENLQLLPVGREIDLGLFIPRRRLLIVAWQQAGAQRTPGRGWIVNMQFLRGCWESLVHKPERARYSRPARSSAHGRSTEL